MAQKKTIILGIGNPLLQDDRAGLEVLEKLEERNVDAELYDVYTVGFEIIDRVKGFDRAICVDACKLGHNPGDILEVELDDIFTNATICNSHAITLGSTLKVGYEVFPEEMPSELKIVLIEIEKCEEFDAKCTPKVQAAVEKVVDRIEAMLKE